MSLITRLRTFLNSVTFDLEMITLVSSANNTGVAYFVIVNARSLI